MIAVEAVHRSARHLRAHRSNIGYDRVLRVDGATSEHRLVRVGTAEDMQMRSGA